MSPRRRRRLHAWFPLGEGGRYACNLWCLTQRHCLASRLVGLPLGSLDEVNGTEPFTVSAAWGLDADLEKKLFSMPWTTFSDFGPTSMYV